ncbi:Gfo/Idh/MocA family oxidoreductase [Paenibacillus sp. J5C_2022]|uniref:Gfo/Idh/MocA family protein n=1 Tax=Paenibacillus sp. J5C2022 TaxID=2977129 RepID=UPI0021CEEE69|nr:Gfo/Idh/MocA family oxidoreductase [Paenibacillus sp. J5C2022]MCU6711286.1 Gfo/Idh/MocA family oxidoreductase [Paenibacillus sp. J5C2022]
MNKVKVGILGLGRWGMCHLEAFSALGQAEVVAICDRSPERLEQAGKTYGIKRLYYDENDLLQDASIDLISVVTFESQHLEPALKALQYGKHVLVEKPVTTRPEEALKMQAAAAASGRLILPGHLLRFDPRYAAIKDAIQSNQVGTPVSMYMKRSRERYLFETFKRVHTVFELMIHDIDLAIWYAGSRVVKVKAYGRTLSGATSPEVLWANLEFENGAIAVLHSNWLTPDKAGIEIADAIEVIGLSGIAHFETSQSGLHIWSGEGRQTPDMNIHVKLHGATVGSLREQLTYICRCIASGEDPAVISFADAVHGIEVANVIVASCETGCEVMVGKME